jgi:outer membrane protein assembly factor BamB
MGNRLPVPVATNAVKGIRLLYSRVFDVATLARAWSLVTHSHRLATVATRTPLAALFLFAFFLSAASGELLAETWPTYRHDNRRSGVSDAELRFPLEIDWVWKSPQRPQTAWTGPAKWDAYSGNRDLQSMRNFDPCFYVTADDQAVYFGSSVDDAVHALDVNTGVERWVHFTGAAVRLPPTIAGGHVYFGSDDGYVYCCAKDQGQAVWRRAAAAASRRITSNRKIISLWPVRTGVLIDSDRATFAASLVPWETSLLWTVDAATGELSGEGCFRRELTDVTLQGAMLASDDLIYVPQGRAPPLAFNRSDGAPQGAIGDAGGVFCVLSEDEMLFAGPPTQKAADAQIRISDPQSKRAIASFSGTGRILVAGNSAWLSSNGKLKSLDRNRYVEAQREIDRVALKLKAAKELKPEPDKALIGELQQAIDSARQQQQSSWTWSVDAPQPLEMIKTRGTIVVGLDGQVRAYDAADGRQVWAAEVDGAAHGLAVAAGRLFVSTDGGHIYAFGAPQ